jgi:hypothetical protein
MAVMTKRLKVRLAITSTLFKRRNVINLSSRSNLAQHTHAISAKQYSLALTLP